MFLLRHKIYFHIYPIYKEISSIRQPQAYKYVIQKDGTLRDMIHPQLIIKLSPKRSEDGSPVK